MTVLPPEAVRKAGALGLFGVCMPAEWGGVGADFVSYVLATEELAAGDAGFCNMVSATNSYGFKVRDYGTGDQKERFLRPVASGAHIACMLLTEPHAGSDAASIRTRAVLKGDMWIINGTKTFVTSGGASTFACIIAVGVVYNAARIALSERGRELATLRVIGFTRGEISWVLLGELAVLTVAAIPLGLVLGHGAAQYAF